MAPGPKAESLEIMNLTSFTVSYHLESLCSCVAVGVSPDLCGVMWLLPCPVLPLSLVLKGLQGKRTPGAMSWGCPAVESPCR